MAKFRSGVIIVLLAFVLKISSTNGLQSFLPPDNSSPDYMKWTARALNAIPSNFTHDMLNIEGAVISDTCMPHFTLYGGALKQLTNWAVKMFDASTKFPESVASGTTVHLGNFDQCLDVKAYDEDGQYAFDGQYCGTQVQLSDGGSFNLYLQIASCMPSTCTPEDVQTLMQTILNRYLSIVHVNAEVTVQPQNCYVEGDKPPLDAGSWVFISILILLALEVLVSTVFDLLKIKSGIEKVDTIMKSFSLSRNVRSLMNTEHARGTIQCLHGLRAMSLLWIILGHRYENTIFVPKINTLQMFKIFEDVSMQLLFNTLLAVDTFFFMSGFLVCYLMMKDLNKGNKFNPLKYYLHRYLRLTTCYAVLIFFYLSLSRDIGYGPMWRGFVNFRTEICQATWWTALLYVDNYVLIKKYTDMGSWSVCAGQGWYLTVDMQLTWVAPLVLLPLWRWPRWTSKFLLLLVLASCFGPFASTYINEYYMTYFTFDPDPTHYLNFVNGMYIASYMRATPYLMGICLAYGMLNPPKRFSLPQWAVVCGWIICTAVSLTLIFAPAVMYQPDYQYDVVASAFYAGFHKLAWSFVLIWIILNCHYGIGGPVNAILSWRGWLPLSRLTYCMYLTHLYIITIDTFEIRTPMHFNHFSILQSYSGDLIFSLMIASTLHFLVEAPTLGLLSAFLKKKTTDKLDEQKKTDDDEQKIRP